MKRRCTLPAVPAAAVWAIVWCIAIGGASVLATEYDPPTPVHLDTIAIIDGMR